MNIRNLVVFLPFILITIVYSSCKNSTADSHEQYRVSNDTLIDWVKNKRFPKPKELDIRDSLGRKITFEEIAAIKNPRDYLRKYYVDDNNQLVKMVITTADENDKLFFDSLYSIENRYRREINEEVYQVLKIDCQDKQRMLFNILLKDQENRQNGVENIDRRRDHENLELVANIIEQCDHLWDGLKAKHATAIFLAIQHSHPIWRKMYEPVIQEGHNQGLITGEQLALLRDRIKMDNDMPQIYGTQIQDGKLWKIDNLDSVRIRRQLLNMMTLEDYLKMMEAEMQ